MYVSLYDYNVFKTLATVAGFADQWVFCGEISHISPELLGHPVFDLVILHDPMLCVKKNQQQPELLGHFGMISLK